MSSHNSNIKKRNLKLKNITFLSPTTQNRLNMTNLFSEPNKIIKSNNSISNVQLTNNFNFNYKTSHLITDLYSNNSSKRQKNYSLTSKNTQRKNINNIQNINKKNNYVKKSTSNSPMLSFSQFSSNLNSANGSKKNIKINPSNSKNYLRKISNLKNLRNKRNALENEYFSCNNSTTNIIKNSINHANKNNKNHKHNFSVSSEHIYNPFSCSSINNIKIYYNQLYKRVNQKNPSNINIINNIHNNKKNNKANSINSQVTSTQSSINKKITKSINSNISNENEINTIKNIETPEELHFFYINILQNGKEVEGRFEVSSSVHN